MSPAKKDTPVRVKVVFGRMESFEKTELQRPDEPERTVGTCVGMDDYVFNVNTFEKILAKVYLFVHVYGT